MLVDAVIVIESLAVALLFRFDEDVKQEWWTTFLAAVLFVVLLRYNGVYQGTRVSE